MKVPLANLPAQYAALRTEMDAALPALFAKETRVTSGFLWEQTTTRRETSYRGVIVTIVSAVAYWQCPP